LERASQSCKSLYITFLSSYQIVTTSNQKGKLESSLQSSREREKLRGRDQLFMKDGEFFKQKDEEDDRKAL